MSMSGTGRFDEITTNAPGVANIALFPPASNLAVDNVAKKDSLNFFTRWIENARFLGALFQAGAVYKAEQTADLTDSTEVAYDLQVGTLVGTGSGLIMGIIFHFLFRSRYSTKKSLNPLYRNFKTLASLGAPVGIFFAYILPLPRGARTFFASIFTDIACIVLGLLALPYWLLRRAAKKNPQKIKNKFTKTGNEGWSKYAKTALVYGNYLGQAMGVLYASLASSNMLASLAIGGGIGAVTSFIASIVLVPVINKYFNKKLVSPLHEVYLIEEEPLAEAYAHIKKNALLLRVKGEKGIVHFIDEGKLKNETLEINLSKEELLKIAELKKSGDSQGKVENNTENDAWISDLTTQACLKTGRPDPKDKFRNNYIRTGITLGLAIGAVLGFIIGTLFFPGLGSLVGMAIGGAFAALAGGAFFGAMGHKISYALQRKLNITADSDNSWDYATRNTSYVTAFLGAAIGFFMPIPGGIFVGAALGSAIGGVIGWGAGLAILQRARKVSPIENKADTLPWTQRLASGANLFSIVGAAIGFGIGLIGGPAGAVAGATLGFALGGLCGSIAGALYDKKARALIKQGILNSPPESTKKLPETTAKNLTLLNEARIKPMMTMQEKDLRARAIAELQNKKDPKTLSIQDDRTFSYGHNRYGSFKKKNTSLDDLAKKAFSSTPLLTPNKLSA